MENIDSLKKKESLLLEERGFMDIFMQFSWHDLEVVCRSRLPECFFKKPQSSVKSPIQILTSLNC